MNNDIIWHSRRLTKASIWSTRISNTRSQETSRNRSAPIDGSVDENGSEADYYDNQRPGAYEITRSRLMSLSSRNWESLEVDLRQRSCEESSHKHRRKYYLAIFIFVVVIILICIGIRFLIQARRKSTSQDENKKVTELCISLGNMYKTNDPFQYCKCIQLLPEIDNDFWNIYNVVKSTRGIAEYINDDDANQICSSTNLAILWITWELRTSLNRNVYIDFESIQTRFILVILYFEWRGNEWKNQTGWLSNETVCEWYGVRCDNQSRVTQLSLRQNNLQGTLESRLGLLRNMRSLDLVYNMISGSIPHELWSLPLLEEVQLSYNLITGAIYYDTGVLVTEGRQESALKFFDIDYNPITGVFPVAGFTSLVNVSLSFTDISGSLPDEIGLLSNLESISLMGNVMLSGTLPSTLALLTMLKNLSLSFTDFTGTLPETIGSMTNLAHIAINSLKIRGRIPSSIGNLTNLEYLDLSHSSLTGAIPSEIGLCTALEALFLQKNLLSGTLPKVFQNLVMINNVMFNENSNLMGDLSEDIVFLSNLNYLNIYSTAITIDCSVLCNATKSGVLIFSSLPACDCN